MLVAVHVGAVLQQQLAHVRLSFVGCMHEGGHPILMRHTTTTTKHDVLCNCSHVYHKQLSLRDPFQAAAFDRRTNNVDQLKEDVKDLLQSPSAQ